MKQIVGLLINLLCCPFILTSQNTTPPSESIFESLSYQDAIDVIIVTNLDSLINERRRNSYQYAQFIYKNKQGEEITRKLKVKPRGKYRRRVCDFPTIKLNFSKKELKANGFLKFDDYKLVTHCLDDEEISKENVLREYLIYKMYNLLSEYSYKVQFLNITYIDINDSSYQLKRAGFLIEDTAELENRLAIEVHSKSRLPIDSFNIHQYNFVSLFQYMVGNVDWSATPFTKNVKTFKSPVSNRFHLIPYDFDFSGLVSPSYQRLAEHLNQKSARERFFLGHLSKPSDLEKQFAQFETKKAPLFDYVKNFKLLSKSSKKDMLKYLQSFYKDIADGTITMASP
jgi:hypothetical protein